MFSAAHQDVPARSAIQLLTREWSAAVRQFAAIIVADRGMSFGKRIDRIGGRRRAPRKRVLAAASALTLRDAKLVVLTNLSKTGARIRGYAINKGKDVWIRTGSIDTLATVVWRRQDLCGIVFDEPLSDYQVAQLQRLTGYFLECRLTPEEQYAAEDWQSGFAR